MSDGSKQTQRIFSLPKTEHLVGYVIGLGALMAAIATFHDQVYIFSCNLNPGFSVCAGTVGADYTVQSDCDYPPQLKQFGCDAGCNNPNDKYKRGACAIDRYSHTENLISKPKVMKVGSDRSVEGLSCVYESSSALSAQLPLPKIRATAICEKSKI